MLRFLAQSLAFVLFVALAPVASAQNQPAPAPAPAGAPAQDLLQPGQIDALVAPIALYSDTLLAEVLMASTYPLEVVQAARWVDENKNLKGDALKAAVDKQGWDDSVKSLTATPSVLAMMSTQLSWTQKLGDAVLAQQTDVMDSVQRLRAKADANNKLQSTPQQKVSKRSEGSKQVIVIEPTDPQTVYVPYYDPAVVYGGWSYPAYPPYYWATPYPGYVAGAAIATGLAFGAGYAVGRWASGGNYWGGGVNWGGNNINVNRPVNINNINAGGNNWNHNPDHRHGVRYNNNNVANKFNKGNNIRNGANNRMDFSGHNGQAALRPGGAGDRPGAGGDRPGAGNRPGGGDRPSAGTRPSGGGKGQARPGGGQGKAAARPSGGARPGGGGGHNAFAGSGGGRASMAQASRGHASMGARGGGGGARMGGGGGGHMGGGGGRGGGRGGGGGGRRSDIALKHDITLLGHLDNGLGFYRFSYNGSDKAYVGVMAQEVQVVAPDAVIRGHDGYLRVFYDKLGLQFQTYNQWIASGARIPSGAAGSN